MRITTQMLASKAADCGMEFNQTSLFDMVTNKNKTSDLLSSISNTKEASVKQSTNKGYKELVDAADILSIYSSKLGSDGENSMFAKAAENNSTSSVTNGVTNIVDSFNTMVNQLTKLGGKLNEFYLKELKALPSEKKDALAGIGITQNEDGTLSIDKNKLDTASLYTLKSIFGSDNDFSKKLNYISNKVSDNAAANMSSTSNQYGSNGMSLNSFEASKYNYIG